MDGDILCRNVNLYIFRFYIHLVKDIKNVILLDILVKKQIKSLKDLLNKMLLIF